MQLLNHTEINNVSGGIDWFATASQWGSIFVHGGTSRVLNTMDCPFLKKLGLGGAFLQGGIANCVASGASMLTREGVEMLSEKMG